MPRLKSAYRESGKVVFAYLHRFSCDGIALIGNEFNAKLNFEIRSPEFAAVANFNGDKSTTEKYFGLGLTTTTLVPQFLTRILYAGAVSVAHFVETNGARNQEIVMCPEDDAILSGVDRFIEAYGRGITPDQFRNINLHLVWTEIQSEGKFRNFIAAIANSLMTSIENGLTREQISAILDLERFWEFRTRYWENVEV